MNQKDKDNRCNMLNPNHPAYWRSRGYSKRPDNWEEKMKVFKTEQFTKQDIQIFCNDPLSKNTRDVSCQYERQDNVDGV